MNNTVPVIERETSSHRYEAAMRISEAIAACREPEELASTLTDEIMQLSCQRFRSDELRLSLSVVAYHLDKLSDGISCGQGKRRARRFLGN
jgi:hypothetical protein